MTRQDYYSELKKTINTDYSGMFNDEFEGLFNRLFEVGYLLVKGFNDGDTVRLYVRPLEEYTPNIYIKDWCRAEDLFFSIKTTSYSEHFTEITIDKIIEGYQKAKEAVKILKSFDYSKLWNMEKAA